MCILLVHYCMIAILQWQDGLKEPVLSSRACNCQRTRDFVQQVTLHTEHVILTSRLCYKENFDGGPERSESLKYR